MNLKLALLPLLGLTACSTPNNSDLALNGFILSGWHTSFSHYSMGGIPSEVFALATPKLDSFVEKLSDEASSEAYFVPQLSGYQVVILTRKRLSDSDQERILAHMDTALSEAQKEAKPLLKSR